MGSLAWPGNQSAPRLQRSASLGQGAINGSAIVRDLVGANETLRFAKANGDACQVSP